MKPPARRDSCLILLVEDSNALRRELASLLRAEGYRVADFAGAVDALRQLRWGMHPCAILLDLRMAVMTGWEFRREVRDDPRLAAIPVVAMTAGNWKPEDLVEFTERIPKPVDVRLLLSLLARYCQPCPEQEPAGNPLASSPERDQ